MVGTRYTNNFLKPTTLKHFFAVLGTIYLHFNLLLLYSHFYRVYVRVCVYMCLIIAWSAFAMSVMITALEFISCFPLVRVGSLWNPYIKKCLTNCKIQLLGSYHDSRQNKKSLLFCNIFYHFCLLYKEFPTSSIIGIVPRESTPKIIAA